MEEKTKVMIVMHNGIDFQPVEIKQYSKLFKLPILRNYAAITLGNTFYCREGLSERLFKHESEHVRQKTKEGTFIFYTKYVAKFIFNICRMFNWKEAYRAISYEVEAREAENKPIVHFGRRH